MALYTQIVEIVAPIYAIAGDIVDVQIKIKNNYSSSLLIMAVVIIDGISFERDNEVEYWVPAGITQSFLGHFTMPGKNITIDARSYWQTSTGTYYLDDEKTKSVSLTQAVWVTVATATLSVDIEAVAEVWVTVATATLSVDVAEVWVTVATATLSVDVAEVWVTVATATLSVDVEVVTEGWVTVATATLTVDIGAIPGDFTNLKVAYSKA